MLVTCPGGVQLVPLPVVCPSAMRWCQLWALCSGGVCNLVHLFIWVLNAYLLSIFYVPDKRALLMGDGDHTRDTVNSATSQMMKMCSGEGGDGSSCCYMQESRKGLLIKWTFELRSEMHSVAVWTESIPSREYCKYKGPEAHVSLVGLKSS